MARYIVPENSDSDSDGIPSRHESSAVIMLEPKPVLDNNLLDDLEETWFDDAGNAHVNNVVLVQKPSLVSELKAASAAVVGDKSDDVDDHVPFRPQIKKSDDSNRSLKVKSIAPNRLSVFEAEGEGGDEVDSGMYADLIDDPFGIGLKSNDSDSVDVVPNNDAGGKMNEISQSSVSDPTLEVLEAKLDMGLITVQEYNHMATLHLATRTLGSNVATSSQRSSQSIVEEASDHPHLSKAEKRIFRMSEQERVRRLTAVRDGKLDVSEAVESIESGSEYVPSAINTNQPVLVGHADVQTAVKQRGEMPEWLTAELLRRELLHVLEEKNEAEQALRGATNKILELENKADALKVSLETGAEKLLQCNQASDVTLERALNAERAAQAALVNGAFAVKKYKQLETDLSERQKSLASMQATHAQDRFALETMYVRIKDLQSTNDTAQASIRDMKSKLEALSKIEEALEEHGIDFSLATASGQEDKVRKMMADAVKSATIQSFESALLSSELAVVIESTMARLSDGESPLIVLVELLETAELREFGHNLVKDGYFGDTVIQAAEAGSIDRALDRFCAIAKSSGGTQIISSIFSVLGSQSPTSAMVALVKGQELQDSIIQIAESGLLGVSMQVLAMSGYLKLGIEYLRNTDIVENPVAGIEQLEKLSENGTLSMVKQFTGENSRMGRIIDRLTEMIDDKTSLENVKAILSNKPSEEGPSLRLDSFKLLLLPKLQTLLPQEVFSALEGLEHIEQLEDLPNKLSSMNLGRDDLQDVVKSLSTHVNEDILPGEKMTVVIDAINKLIEKDDTGTIVASEPNNGSTEPNANNDGKGALEPQMTLAEGKTNDAELEANDEVGGQIVTVSEYPDFFD